MKTIKHNGYTLPNVGASVVGVKDEDRKEFISLIQKSCGGEYLFCGSADNYGIPLEELDNYAYYFKHFYAERYYTLLPITEAITWLKIALGEITKENFAIDVTQPHERLDEFKKWFNKDRGIDIGWRYYFFENGKKDRMFNSAVRQSIPVITLDMFFTYFYDEPEVNTEVKQPVKGDLVEVSDDGIEWDNDEPRIFTGGISERGKYIVEVRDIITLRNHIRLVPPQPTKRQLAEKKAIDFCKETGHDTVPGILEAITEYILENENA